jgi:hypothetical protein
MIDERQDSMRQGIGAPPESPAAKEAEQRRRRDAPQEPEIEGGIGGTSDSDSPGDEAAADAARHAGRGSKSES